VGGVGGIAGEKKWGVVCAEGPVLPRPERDILEAGKKRVETEGADPADDIEDDPENIPSNA